MIYFGVIHCLSQPFASPDRQLLTLFYVIYEGLLPWWLARRELTISATLFKPVNIAGLLIVKLTIHCDGKTIIDLFLM